LKGYTLDSLAILGNLERPEFLVILGVQWQIILGTPGILAVLEVLEDPEHLEFLQYLVVLGSLEHLVSHQTRPFLVDPGTLGIPERLEHLEYPVSR
jgi:hypothetical protein